MSAPGTKARFTEPVLGSRPPQDDPKARSLLSEALDRLTELVTEAVQQAGVLRSTLDAEHDALLASDAEHLEVIIQRKQALVTRLEAIAQEQSALLLELGYEFNSEGFESLLSEGRNRSLTRQTQQVEDVWAQMRRRLEDCQTHNQRNQNVLANQQRRVRAALEILRGGEPGAPVYDARGRAGAPRAPVTQRPLSRA